MVKHNSSKKQKLHFSYLYAHWIFPKLLGLVILGTLCAVLLHLSSLTLTFLFYEDIWERTPFTLTNFWYTGSVSKLHFSPLTNLLLALTNEFFPLWGPLSHFPLIIMNLIFFVLCFRFLRKKLQLSQWLCWLGLGLFVTMPIIIEGTFWISGFHHFLSPILFLGALNTFPENAQRDKWKNWVLPAIFLLAMLSSNPLTYGSYFLIILSLAWQSRKHTPILLLWLTFFLMGIVYIYLRNWVLFGNGFTFHEGMKYVPDHGGSFRQFMQGLVAVLEYSNPLIILQRHLQTGYLTYSSQNLINLLHLVWVLPIWAIVLFRKNALLGWGVFLYGAGVIAMLTQLQPPFPPRYFLSLSFVQIVGIILFIHHTVHPLQLFRKLALLVLGLAIMTANLSAKVNIKWHDWIIPDQMEQAILETVENAEDQTIPFVFLTYKEKKTQQYSGGADATYAGLRKVLSYANISACIYAGYHHDTTKEEIENSLYQNAYSFYIYGKPEHYSCPLILKKNQQVQCYEYDYTLGHFGKFQNITGMVNIASNLGNLSSRDYSQDVNVPVHCKKNKQDLLIL